MPNKVKNAIDGGLGGLYVTQRDVDRIMSRVRTDAVPQKRRVQPMRMAAVLAMCMVMLLASVTVKLSLEMQQRHVENEPLTQVDGTGEDGVKRSVVYKVEDAVAIVEAYIHAHEDEAVDLRDETVYRIDVVSQEENLLCRVTFTALNEYATEYAGTVDLSSSARTVMDFTRQRGVGEGHTAQEILAGYQRVYGEDRRMWTAHQLNTYSLMLGSAQTSSLHWEDLLFMNTSYVDTLADMQERASTTATSTYITPTPVPYFDKGAQSESGTAITAESIKTAVLDGMESDTGVQCEITSMFCIRQAEKRIWRIAVKQVPGSPDAGWTYLLEVDADTGDICYITYWSRPNADAEMEVFFLSELMEEMKSAELNNFTPTITEDEAKDAAVKYISSRFNPRYDVQNEALYEFIASAVQPYTYYRSECVWQLIFRPLVSGAPDYEVYVDWYGEVMTCNVIEYDEQGNMVPSMAAVQQTADVPGAMTGNMNDVVMERIRKAIIDLGMVGDPVADLLMNTHLVTGSIGEELPVLAGKLVGARTVRYEDSALFSVNGQSVWKLALSTDRGNFLVEIDAVSMQGISVVQVENLYEPWYARFLLQSDMEAAGVAPTPYTLPQNSGEVLDSGTVAGMMLQDVYARFKALYGPDMCDWTQAQLRSFREMAILSSDSGGDLGIYCLRNTYFPDVTDDMITEEEATRLMVEHYGFTDYVFDGAVLIGRANASPVWKVCLLVDGCYWYQEVNAHTGSLLKGYKHTGKPATICPVYTDDRYDEYWFRDIVLEQTIIECKETWKRTANG
ncbi:MAG: hypothetical protein IJ438_11820 [Clostridia bacterium]|nr:hypothetical protein [Clostridia bacterium]